MLAWCSISVASTVAPRGTRRHEARWLIASVVLRTKTTNRCRARPTNVATDCRAASYSRVDTWERWPAPRWTLLYHGSASVTALHHGLQRRCARRAVEVDVAAHRAVGERNLEVGTAESGKRAGDHAAHPTPSRATAASHCGQDGRLAAGHDLPGPDHGLRRVGAEVVGDVDPVARGQDHRVAAHARHGACRGRAAAAPPRRRPWRRPAPAPGSGRRWRRPGRPSAASTRCSSCPGCSRWRWPRSRPPRGGGARVAVDRRAPARRRAG